MIDMERKELTEKIIGCAFRAYNAMGYGYLESVYENCLAIELHACGLTVERQKPLRVLYKEQLVGEFAADLIVNGTILVELKSVRVIAPAHEVQLVNYLCATGFEVGLVINFGEAGVEVRRKLRTLPGSHQSSRRSCNPVQTEEQP